MVGKVLGLAVVVCALLSANASAQAPAPGGATPASPAGQPPAGTPTPPAPPAGQPPAGTPTPAPPAGQTPAGAGRGGANQGVGSQGDPDPGVHFIVLVDNPQVRVLQVTLQPGAVRRPHVHNDVTFHMLVQVTGSLELNVDGTVTATMPGQAYYMIKGQVHGFTNKSAAAVQVVELFIKPPAAAAAP
jgi:quercetin dioxygenase-like cupin family protein